MHRMKVRLEQLPAQGINLWRYRATLFKSEDPAVRKNARRGNVRVRNGLIGVQRIVCDRMVVHDSAPQPKVRALVDGTLLECSDG